MKALLSEVRAFVREEDGVALSEYLILLGLLIGGVLATVQLAGTNLNAAWATWAGFFTTLSMPAA
jgi:pilus assembly protein Flp/PilA